MEKLDLRVESADRKGYILFSCSNYDSYVLFTNDRELSEDIVNLLRDAADFIESTYLNRDK